MSIGRMHLATMGLNAERRDGAVGQFKVSDCSLIGGDIVAPFGPMLHAFAAPVINFEVKR